MIEKDRDDIPGGTDTPGATPEEMAQALESIKSSSPSLAQDLAAAKMTPGKLADALKRATSEEDGEQPPTLREG